MECARPIAAWVSRRMSWRSKKRREWEKWLFSSTLLTRLNMRVSSLQRRWLEGWWEFSARKSVCHAQCKMRTGKVRYMKAHCHLLIVLYWCQWTLCVSHQLCCLVILFYPFPIIAYQSGFLLSDYMRCKWCHIQLRVGKKILCIIYLLQSIFPILFTSLLDKDVITSNITYACSKIKELLSFDCFLFLWC